MTGLVVDDAGFEVLAGEQRIGPRRVIQPDDVELLTGLARRYVRAVQAGSRPEEFIAIGRALFTWLDGDSGQLTRLLEESERPLVFEVQGPRTPSGQAWAVLRAPFELLARPVSGPAAESAGGFLAEDAIIRLLAARGATDEAREVYAAGVAAARKIEWENMAKQIEKLIEALPAPEESGST